MNAIELGLQSGEELFEGEYRSQMARLQQGGFTPWSTENIMDARNKVSGEHFLWETPINTNYGIVGTKTEVYLLPHSTTLNAITPQASLIENSLPLNKAAIDDFFVYTRDHLILNRELTDEEARNSPVWLGFAAGDQKRLDTYVENTFRLGKDKFKYNKMMGIFVPREEEFLQQSVGLTELSKKSMADSNPLDNYVYLVGTSRDNSISDKNNPDLASQAYQPFAITDPAQLPTLEKVEREYISHALKVMGGNKTQTAEILGIDRRTLYRMLDRWKQE